MHEQLPGSVSALSSLRRLGFKGKGAGGWEWGGGSRGVLVFARLGQPGEEVG